MKLVENVQSTVTDVYNGIAVYCNEFKCTQPKGNDNEVYPGQHSDFDFWGWVTRNISNGNPFAISLEPSKEYFLGVGYQRTSTGNFIRIANSADSSLSHFINFSL